MMMNLNVAQPRAFATSNIAVEFQQWIDLHKPRLIDFHEDPTCFGNVTMIMEKDKVRIRLTLDRNDFYIDLAVDDNWVDAVLVDSFIRSVPVSMGRAWPEFDPLLRPALVANALRNPALPNFVQTANEEMLKEIGFSVAS